MAAVPRDIVIQQGSTWRLAFTFCAQARDVDDELVFEADGVTPVAGEPYNLTGCTARMHVRKAANSELWLASTTDADDPDDLTVGGITLGGVLGTVELLISDEKSEALDLTTGPFGGPFKRIKVGVYDAKLYWPSGDEEHLLTGAARVKPSVTKDA